VLRKRFILREIKLSEEWDKLHNEKLNGLHVSLVIVIVVELLRL
jgi:hypothetical protein